MLSIGATPIEIMQLTRTNINCRCDDAGMFEPWLARVGGRLLELGCGDGRNARALIADRRVESVLALEVDTIQHAKNLEAGAPAGLRFGVGAAEAIPASDGAFDMVFMFKSLHHVPVEHMDRALAEVHRVLRPGGIAYVSEPVFAGRFSDLLAPFHDESGVRRRAFEALVRAVEAERFTLEEERFFLQTRVFRGFSDFDEQIIRATYTDHRLEPEVLAEVQRRFAKHHEVNGGVFFAPQRVDVLRRGPSGDA